MVEQHLWIWTMFKAKAKVRVPRHVSLVEKLVMFPKTVGMASQRVLHLRPLARAQAQKAHLLVRVPRVQKDLQKEKANHPKERTKARWDPNLESNTPLRTKRTLSSGLKNLRLKVRRLGMKKLGQTKMANGKSRLVNKVQFVLLPVLIQHSKHLGRENSPSMRRRWKENRKSSCWERFGSALKCFGLCRSAEDTVLLEARPKVKPEKFGSKHVENVDDDSSEYTIDSQDMEEGESEAFEVKDEEVEVPQEQHEEPPEEPHDEPPEEVPEETAEDLEALREEKGKDLAKKDIKALEKKKREEKEALQKKPVGFTPGAVAKFTQALIMQKLEGLFQQGRRQTTSDGITMWSISLILLPKIR